MTCAHVVNDAWGNLPYEEKQKLVHPVYMDFPLINPKLEPEKRTAKVVDKLWVRAGEKKQDVAFLKLDAPKPVGAKSARLVSSEDMWGHEFRVYGVPEREDEGTWASGILKDYIAGGKLHVEDVKEPGPRIRRGFSGAPVWDEQLKGVVGMVVEENTRAREKVGHIIPSDVLADLWPELNCTRIMVSWLPEPWNFDSFLSERRKYFTGRDWLFDNINDWLSNGAGSAMLITGGPGTGKSAVVAELVNRDLNKKLLAYYVCQADTPATLEPVNFIYNVVVMLSKNVSGYAAILENPDVKQALSQEEILKHPMTAFEKGILYPLQSLGQSDNHYILIDALDEAFAHSATPNIVDILAARLEQFPKWLKLIATTRPEISVLQNLMGHKIKLINIEDPRSKGDIALYIDERLVSSPLMEIVENYWKSKSHLKKALISSCDGNFLILTTILKAIELEEMTFDEVEKLSMGLSALYAQFFRRIYFHSQVDFEPARKALQVIVAAQEPPTHLELATILEVDAEYDLPKIMKHLSSFVPLRDKRYVLFHRSLFEWLTGWNDEIEQPIAGDFHISLKAGHTQWSNFLRSTYLSGRKSEQVLRYLPLHLKEAQRWNDLANLLLDWRFMEAKVSGPTTVYDLISDFYSAIDSLPLDNPRRHLILLLSQILRFGEYFLYRHSNSLFQFCWNFGWWYDSPQAAQFYSSLNKGKKPWESSAEKLYKLLENWRNEKEHDSPSFIWLRSLIPPSKILIDSVKRNVIYNPEASVTCFDVSPDGTRIVSLDSNRNIKLWNLTHGPPTDGYLLATIFPEDSNYPSQLTNVELAIPRKVIFSPIDDFIIVGLSNGELQFLDPNTLEPIKTDHTGWKDLFSLTISHDGSLIAMGSESGWIRLWDVKKHQELCAKEVSQGCVVEQVVFAPKKQLLASFEKPPLGGTGTIKVWKIDVELSEFSFIGNYQTNSDRITALCFSADGNTLLWNSQEGYIEFRNLVTGAEMHVPEEKGRPIESFAVLPEGDRLLYATEEASGNATIILLELAPRRIVRQFSGHVCKVSGMKLLRNARSFASVDDKTIRVWDLGDSALSVELILNEPEVSEAIFDPNKPFVFTMAENNNKIWIRSLEDWKTVYPLEEKEGKIHSMALNKDGTILAYGMANGTVRLVKTGTWKNIFSYSPHSDVVEKLTFSPDGKLIASAHQDGEVRFFDINSQKQIDYCLSGFVGPWKMNVMKFSNNGQMLATSGTHKVAVWNIKSEKMISNFFVGQHYTLHFAENDQKLIVENNPTMALAPRTAYQIATGEKLEASEANKLFNDFQHPLGMIWKYAGNFDSKERSITNFPIVLVSVSDNSALAWLETSMGIINYHPSGRMWSIRNDHNVGIYKLETHFGLSPVQFTPASIS